MKSDMLGFYFNSATMYSITDLFTLEFQRGYSQLRGNRKALVLDLLPHFYRRWYYSTLSVGKPFSPANIINSQIFHEFGSESMLIPKIKYKICGDKVDIIQFDVSVINLESHYIVEDLRILIENCIPAVEIYEDMNLNEETVLLLMKKLTYEDANYVYFLTALAFELKLLKKMTSIYTLRAYVTEDHSLFFQYTERVKLAQILDASITVSAKKLADYSPLGNKLFTIDFIYNLLRFPRSTVDIYEQIYSTAGIHFHGLLEDLSDDSFPLAADISTVKSSLYILGILLDTWFFCPFGYYLQIIQPLNASIYHIGNELRHVYNKIKAEHDINYYIFTPSSQYDLSVFGAQLLSEESNYTSNQLLPSDLLTPFFYQKLIGADLRVQKDQSQHITKTSLRKNITSVPKNDNTDTQEGTIIKDRNKTYIFKVKLYSYKRHWKMIEIKGTQTLSDLQSQIIDSFHLTKGQPSSFFMSHKTVHPNSKLEFFHNGSRALELSKARIFTLCLSQKQKFSFVYEMAAPIQFEIELYNVREIEKDAVYPRMINQSKV